MRLDHFGHQGKPLHLTFAAPGEPVFFSVPGAELTNVAFGGPDRKTLYITHLGDPPGLDRVELSVPGMPY